MIIYYALALVTLLSIMNEAGVNIKNPVIASDRQGALQSPHEMLSFDQGKEIAAVAEKALPRDDTTKDVVYLQTCVISRPIIIMDDATRYLMIILYIM